MTLLASDIKIDDRALIRAPQITLYTENKQSANLSSSYFLVTELKSSKYGFSTNVITYDFIRSHNIFAKEFNIISISKKMFAGTKPMTGQELIVLKKTASRMISKIPTSLKK